MGLINELRTYLAGKSAITAVTSTRIYQTHLPQGYQFSTGVAVSMLKVSEQHYHTLSTSSGVATARVQIDVWGLDEDTCEAVVEAIRLVLQSYTGAIGNITCLGITLDDINSLPEAPEDGSNEWRQHIACDYLITYRNAVAPA